MLAEREGGRVSALPALKMLSKDKIEATDIALQEAGVSITSVKCLQPAEHDQCWLAFLNTHIITRTTSSLRLGKNTIFSLVSGKNH